jgi:splicing factor U2AF subunit
MGQTLLLAHMYPNTPESLAIACEEPWDEDMYDRAQQHLEAFYIEVFLELANFGEIEDMVVCDNLCDHLIGNVYVKYYEEDAAERALTKLTGRFYRATLLNIEYSTVTDFREARCRAFHETRCNRGAYCNFLHMKHVPKAIKRRIVREMYREHPEYMGAPPKMKKKKDKKEKKRDRSRSRSRRRDRGDRSAPLALDNVAHAPEPAPVPEPRESGRDRDRDRDRDRRRDEDRDRDRDRRRDDDRGKADRDGDHSAPATNDGYGAVSGGDYGGDGGDDPRLNAPGAADSEMADFPIVLG